MKERGLSIKGDRQTLVKRHQEFTIIYNSECSKPKPKSVAEIVRLVEEGERKKNKAVEKRDKLNFDRDQTPEDIDKMKFEYMSQNQNEFTRLINEIRNRKKKDENNSDDSKSNEASTSKADQTPSTMKKKFALKLLPSDDDTASNSSGADFEPVQKRSNTPRRQLRSSTEKRKTRSSAEIPEEIVEDSCDDTSNTIGDEGEEECDCDDPVDPIESCITSATLPDPPSPSLLDDFDEKESNHSNAESSESESMLRPAFDPSSPTQDEIPESPPQGDDGNQSEEIEF
ncbi:E3 ubiquitin- ligase RAD18 [Paramuricea clavata]|uniref:E3 ubiquitin- ligase RAD18, partial n=2 Tax=Paramuricea clavata TaxID=317549 RepID=A0A6S7FS65_PARCT|nr:E3 ubiquitin- ligase RAD18 [Paramuricea clavata]